MTIKKQQVWRVVIDTATYSNTSKEKVLSLANSSIEKQLRPSKKLTVVKSS